MLNNQFSLKNMKLSFIPPILMHGAVCALLIRESADFVDIFKLYFKVIM